MTHEKEQTPRVSVIIPVYNTVRYLGECLDSLLAQTERSWECLAVDDGSTDGSGAMLDAYAARDSRIRAFHQTNGGAAVARNTALDSARGEWVMMMDSDDTWAPTLLEKMLCCAEENNVELVQVGYGTYRDGKTESVFLPLRKIGCHVLPVNKFFARHTTSYNWDKMIRRDLLERYGIRYDSRLRFSQDLPVMVQYCAASERVGIVGEPLYHFRLHAASTTARFYAGKHTEIQYRNMLDSVLISTECLVGGAFPAARVRELYPAMLSWLRGRLRDTRRYMPTETPFDISAHMRKLKWQMFRLAPPRHKLRAFWWALRWF